MSFDEVEIMPNLHSIGGCWIMANDNAWRQHIWCCWCLRRTVFLKIWDSDRSKGYHRLCYQI